MQAKLVAPITVAAVMTLLASSDARAAVADQSMLTPTDVLTVGGMPSPDYTEGQWYFTGTFYQGAPVYTHETSGWSMYRRADGKWYVDSNAIEETQNGTVTSTSYPSQVPWGVKWASGRYAVTRTAAVYVDYYGSLAGVYTFEGEARDGKPVYERDGAYVSWDAANARWIFADDIDSPLIVYSYSFDCSDAEPTNCDWLYAAQVVDTVNVTVEHMLGLITGVYGFEGLVHEDRPVWESGLRSLRYQSAASDRWALMHSSTTYETSNASCQTPWSCSGWGGTVVHRGEAVSTTQVALETKFGTYLKADAGVLSADGNNIGAKKIFDLIELDTGETLLRAADGEFVCDDGQQLTTRAQPDGGCYLTAFYTDSQVAFMGYGNQYIGVDKVTVWNITTVHPTRGNDSVGNKQLFTLVEI